MIMTTREQLARNMVDWAAKRENFDLPKHDNERAFFDSADWALGKQSAGLNQISTAAIETLQPKLKVRFRLRVKD
ncbi:hypothetical protein CTI12_AA504470 [Artemisia annua]|uniref:Uncharacterized protein n=1 Tax=Artemisia annua TaxID=35608 RepID=A0A2U1LCW9_ARTAN|nr:hypothetical protein CTI12_AA504470 [Artemisia annua]